MFKRAFCMLIVYRRGDLRRAHNMPIMWEAPNITEYVPNCVNVRNLLRDLGMLIIGNSE